MKIPLTQGKFTIIDDAFSHLSKWKWFALKSRNTFYAVRNFKKSDGARGLIKLHHCVIGFPLNGRMVDHRDGSGLNNLSENLRHVTNRENTWNKKVHRTGAKVSRFVGVTRSKDRDKWKARIQINGRTINIGSFKKEDDATEAYRKALELVL